MAKSSSERRLEENEVVFRQLNEQVQKGFDEIHHMAAEEGQPEFAKGTDDLALYFYCECSDENCTKRIKVSTHEYNNIHKERDHFIAVPGHEVPSIEHVVRKEDGFNVIEKREVPNVKVAKLRKTEVDNT